MEPILRHLQYSAATLDHLAEMSHSAYSNIDTDAKLLGVIFDEMHRERGHAHYAAIFEHEEAAHLVAQLVACLLNWQGVPLGEDFAKSPFLEGLELSAVPKTLTADESIPAESEEPVDSASGSVSGGEEEPTQVGS